MLTILKAPAHVLAIKLDGTVTTDDIAEIKPELDSKLAAHDRISFVVDFTGFDDATADALVADFKMEMGLMSELDRFPKVAIVSGKQWIDAAMGMAGKFMPVDVKSFAPGKVDQAIAFAADLPPKPRAAGPTVTRIKTENPRLFAFEFDGKLTGADVDAMVEPLQDAFGKYDKIDLLVRLRNYDGFDWSILTQQSLISIKLESMQHVRRYAIVGAKDWMKSIIAVFAPMVSIDMRTFDASEEDKAWAWLKS